MIGNIIKTFNLLSFYNFTGHKEIMELLLLNGATVNDIDRNGWTLLHWAALNGNSNKIFSDFVFGIMNN